MPEQTRSKARKPAHRDVRRAAPAQIIIDEPVVVLPGATPRQRSEDVEQMFIDLTRRAPSPAVGPSHWWG
ncbi:MAG: hypothetical protein ACJ71T_14440 [Actinomycetales bacterium]